MSEEDFMKAFGAYQNPRALGVKMTDTIRFQQEYQLKNGQSISIQFDIGKDCWEVACWNADGYNHWYKEYADTGTAIREYEKYK